MSTRAKRKREVPASEGDAVVANVADRCEMDSAPPGIAPLWANLQKASDTGFCKTDKARRLKQEVLRKAINAVKDRENQKFLVRQPKYWKNLSQWVLQLAAVEHEENKQKVLSENNAFELFRLFCELQIAFSIDGIDKPALAKHAAKVFLLADQRFREQMPALFRDCVICLTTIMDHYPISETQLKPDTFEAIWTETVRMCRAHSGPNNMAFLLNLLLSATKRLGETSFGLRIPVVVSDLENLLKDQDLTVISGTNALFLDVVSEIFDRQAVEHRELLISKFKPIPLAIAGCVSLKKFMESEAGKVSYQSSLLRLIDLYVAVAVPGGDITFVDEEGKADLVALIGDSLEKVMYTDLKDMGKVSAYRTTMVPFVPERFSAASVVVSRLLVVDHRLEVERAKQAKSGRKRPRDAGTGTYLFQLLDSCTAHHLQVMATVLRRWNHLLTEDEIQSVADKLVPLEGQMKGADKQKVARYMECFAEILTAKVSLTWSDAVVKLLWKMGLTYMTFPDTCAMSSFLLRSVYPKVTAISRGSKDYPFLTVMSNIARISTFPEESVHLLGFLLSTAEFDEKSVFRYDLLSDGNDPSTSELWPFRCQIIQALCEDEHIRSYIGDLLLTISMLVPKYTTKKRNADISKMETRLMKLFNRSIQAAVKEEKERNLLIPDIVDFVLSLLIRICTEQTDSQLLIQYWSVLLRYYHGLEQYGCWKKIRGRGEVFQSIGDKIISFFGQSDESDDELLRNLLSVGSDVAGSASLAVFLTDMFHANGYKRRMIADILSRIAADTSFEAEKHSLSGDFDEESLSAMFSTASPRFLAAEVDFDRISPSAITEKAILTALERFVGDDIGLARFAERILCSTNAFSVHSSVFAFLVSKANDKVTSACKALIPRFYDYVRSHVQMIAYHIHHMRATDPNVEMSFLSSTVTKSAVEKARNTSSFVKQLCGGLSGDLPLQLISDIFNASATPAFLRAHFLSSRHEEFVRFWRNSASSHFTTVMIEMYKSLLSVEKNSVYTNRSAFVWLPAAIEMFRQIETREMTAEVRDYVDSSFVMMAQKSICCAIHNVNKHSNADSRMKMVVEAFVTLMESKLPYSSSNVFYRYLFVYDLFFEVREEYPATWQFLSEYQSDYRQMLEDQQIPEAGCATMKNLCMLLKKQFENDEVPKLGPFMFLKGFWICFSNCFDAQFKRNVYEWILVAWFCLKDSRRAIAEVLHRFPPDVVGTSPIWCADLTDDFMNSLLRSLLFDSREFLPVSVYLRLQKAFNVNDMLDPSALNSSHRNLTDLKVALSLKVFRTVLGRYRNSVPPFYEHLAEIEEISSISIICLPILIKKVVDLDTVTLRLDGEFFHSLVQVISEFCKTHENDSDPDRALLAAFAKCLELIYGRFGSGIEFPEASNVFSFVTCLINAKLFEYANFFLHRYVDSLNCGNAEMTRHMFAFNEPEYRFFLDVLRDVTVARLFTKIFMGLHDTDAISQLPLTFQLQDDVRAFLCRERCDWAKATSDDKRLMADSFYATGKRVDPGTFPRNVVYENAIRLSTWDTVDEFLSFPKKGLSHAEKLYATLYTLKFDQMEETEKLIRMNLTETLNTLSESFLLDRENLRNFLEFDTLGRLSTDRTIHEDQAGLELSWRLSKLTPSSTLPNEDRDSQVHRFKMEMRGLLPHLLKRCRVLRELNASAPAKKLIDTFGRANSKHISPYSNLDYFLEIGRVNIEYGEQVFTKNLLLRAFEKVMGKASSDSENLDQRWADLGVECGLMLSRMECRAEKSAHLSEVLGIAHHCQPRLQTKALMQCGHFAEAEYLEKAEIVKSEAFALKKKAIESWTSENAQLQEKHRLSPGNKEIAKQIIRNQREIAREQAHITHARKVLADRCETAVKCYLGALVNCDDGKAGRLLVYRITSLLMQNVESQNIVQLIQQYVDKIPSYQWIHVVNHLSSHMFKENDVSELVKEIIANVITDHPYHSLNYIFFYTSDLKESNAESEKRKRLANAFLARCSSTSTRRNLKNIIEDLKNAHESFVQFADANPRDGEYFDRTMRNGKQVHALRKNLSFYGEQDSFRKVPIPIVQQKLKHDGNYDLGEMVCFDQISDFCVLADGLSRPKVIGVRGTDGVAYRLIAKSEDLRQDSLVQQLFDVANLAISEVDTQALRTYCVLPLNAENGFIEFCQDTTSLCDCLVGPGRNAGLHKKYYPEDKTAAEVRKLFADQRVQERDDAAERFLKLCEHIHPAFRFFFYETFTTARAWRQALNRYTNSLAQWSIVCYITGLGDRHLNNVLIDKKTGQLIHIDLGMIFDYSNRVLPIPERVPFRLTRDLVDPLLIDGIQGSFKRVAIETLRKIREEANILYGIGSLLLTDPISSFKTSIHNPDEHSMLAKTALSRFKQKLSGMDLSDQTHLSVEDQVTTLIDDARNPENLARMFVGWMAFI